MGTLCIVYAEYYLQDKQMFPSFIHFNFLAYFYVDSAALLAIL